MSDPDERRLALATALEAVTAAMIHDLSQPLAAIVTSGEACLRWLDRPEPGIGDAKAAATRIVDTAMAAGDKLSGYRRPAGEGRWPIDLPAIVRGAIGELAGEAVPITLSDTDVPAVNGDAALLRIALLHVLRNAIEAIGRGGGSSIAVTLSRGAHGEAVIAVMDDGPGPPADEKKLFKPFYSTLPGRLGLGLAIAKTVAESHGGRIRIVPGAGGRGTLVEIALPPE